MNETVYAVKKYLDGELAKYETWEKLGHVNKSINMLFDSNSQFQNCKKNGVGQTTILKFLGGNFKQWMIQEALATLRQSEDPFRKFSLIKQIRREHQGEEHHDGALTPKLRKVLSHTGDITAADIFNALPAEKQRELEQWFRSEDHTLKEVYPRARGRDIKKSCRHDFLSSIFSRAWV